MLSFGIYPCTWHLRYVQKLLQDNRQMSTTTMENLQEALELAIQLVKDSEEALNEAFDVGYQAAARDFSNADWDAARVLAHIAAPHPLGVEKLKTARVGDWVWIEVLRPGSCGSMKTSTYVKVHPDLSDGESLCCGYPGLSYHLDYNEYGHSWLAYPHQPVVEKERKSE